MIDSFKTEATLLDRRLLDLQCEGWTIISVNPIKEERKEWGGSGVRDYYESLFIVVAENKKLKPIKYWRVKDEEFYTRKEAWDYAKLKELNPYCCVHECYDYVEVEEDESISR